MRLAATIGVAVIAIALHVTGIPAAAAPPEGGTTCNGFGECVSRVRDQVPSSSSAASPARTPPRSGAECTSGGSVIPCSVNGAYWSSGYGCYITPTAADPVAAGFTPEQVAAHEGESLHQCIPYNLVAGGRGIPAQGFFRWLAAGTTPAAVVDPEVLARSAIEQMNLRPVDIGLAPPPGGLGFVGLPVHMWAADTGGATWQAESSVSAGAVSVTARAQVQRVDWSMGDGTVVRCGRGTAFGPGRGAAPSPDCGHTYTRTSAGRPGAAYDVTATSHWRVEWTATTGAEGVIELDLATSQPLRIGESQVVITRG